MTSSPDEIDTGLYWERFGWVLRACRTAHDEFGWLEVVTYLLAATFVCGVGVALALLAFVMASFALTAQLSLTVSCLAGGWAGLLGGGACLLFEALYRGTSEWLVVMEENRRVHADVRASSFARLITRITRWNDDAVRLNTLVELINSGAINETQVEGTLRLGREEYREITLLLTHAYLEWQEKGDIGQANVLCCQEEGEDAGEADEELTELRFSLMALDGSKSVTLTPRS